MRYPPRMKAQYGITISLLSCLTLMTAQPASAEAPEKPAPEQPGDPENGSLATLADRLLPQVMNVSASASIHPGDTSETSPDEGGPDSGPDQGPQIPKICSRLTVG
ncbi:MAG: hypothetical protein AAYR33_08570 [Acetobacteraceae bacterium]